jgi:lipopolysaccharide transport system ATP-binding protein
MSDIAVKLENISKFYKLYNEPRDRLKEALHPFGKKYHRRFFALRNINLEVRKGEILGIIGKNGSGKSTLLKLISGIVQPSSGEIAVKGKVSALLELGSGLNPEFTGTQNIYFSGTMMGFSRKEMEEKIDDIVDFADIGDFIHQPLKTYSTGMKARLGFALAINMEPEILILDEVMSVGDELFKRKCYAKMEEFFKSGCTVLYVTHSLNSINEICSRVFFLDKGEQILEGPPKLVTVYYQKYLFAKPENAAKIRNEIIKFGKDEEKKKKFAKKLGKDSKRQVTNEKEVTPQQESFYIPDLIPKSTVVTKNFDIDISDVHITTLAGEKVNLLVTDENYFLTYKVKFNSNCTDVIFGIVVKTFKGFPLLEARLNPIRESLKNIKSNDEFLIKCKFRCNLLMGTYLIDLGIVRFENGTRIMLCVISDALIFKVQKSEDGREHKGIIFTNHETTIIKNSYKRSELLQSNPTKT